ncbi:MAG: ribonuclease H family protein [Eubacterium sp.]|nr:ribonuclease H family protein [Eubacterium sp.]
MSKKYYAVKVGKVTGVFETWEECEASVKGYPGALYKSFKSEAEAYAYMGWSGQQLTFDNLHEMQGQEGPLSNEQAPDEDMPFSNTVKAVAYVDGSFNEETGEFGYGVVMFYKGEESHMKGASDDADLVDMRNVAGEIQGAEKAMEFAVKNKISNITIYHDYLGISKWCSGEWKANKKGTIDYRKFYDQCKKKVNIIFEKVDAHTGDKYNELADKLAKEAVGIK